MATGEQTRRTLQRILGNGLFRAGGRAGAAGRRGKVSPAQSLRSLSDSPRALSLLILFSPEVSINNCT